MNLTFQIDDNYLAAHTLKSLKKGSFSSDRYRATLSRFGEYAKDSHPGVYKKMSTLKYPEIVLYKPSPFAASGRDLKDLRKSAQFKRIKHQVEKYADFLENQWERNRDESTGIVQELTGFDLTDDEFTVLVTHPSLRNGYPLGRYLGQKKVAWGHNEDWKNYSTVYLWHEILHDYLANNRLNHAIIQLIADNELRIRLNGGKYPPFIGHEKLFALMEQLMPAWEDHLQKPDFDAFRKRSKQLIKRRKPHVT